MMRYNIISYYVILLLLSVSSVAAVYSPIVEQIEPGTITIIGETYKKAESIELFQNLALNVIRHYQCVVIALEIASDQQTILDTVMQGRASSFIFGFQWIFAILAPSRKRLPLPGTLAL